MERHVQRTHQSYCRRRRLPGRVVVLLGLCYGWGRGRRASRRVSRWGYKFLLVFGHVVQAFERLLHSAKNRSFVHSCWLGSSHAYTANCQQSSSVHTLHWRHVRFREAKESTYTHNMITERVSGPSTFIVIRLQNLRYPSTAFSRWEKAI